MLLWLRGVERYELDRLECIEAVDTIVWRSCKSSHTLAEVPEYLAELPLQSTSSPMRKMIGHGSKRFFVLTHRDEISQSTCPCPFWTPASSVVLRVA